MSNVTTFIQASVDLREVHFKAFQEFVDFLKLVYDHVTVPINDMKANVQIICQGRRSDAGLRVASRLYHVPYRLQKD